MIIWYCSASLYLAYVGNARLLMYQYFLLAFMEAAGSITFGRHVSNWLKTIYSESWRQELLIGIYMGWIGEAWGGVVPRCGYIMFGGVSSFFWATSTDF